MPARTQPHQLSNDLLSEPSMHGLSLLDLLYTSSSIMGSTTRMDYREHLFGRRSALGCGSGLPEIMAKTLAVRADDKHALIVRLLVNMDTVC